MSANHTPALMQPSVPAAIQAAVDQAEWADWIAEHLQKSDGVCPKCSIGRLRFYQPKSEYQCDAGCGYVEAASKNGIMRSMV